MCTRKDTKTSVQTCTGLPPYLVLSRNVSSPVEVIEFAFHGWQSETFGRWGIDRIVLDRLLLLRALPRTFMRKPQWHAVALEFPALF